MHDMAHLSSFIQNAYFCGMIQHSLVLKVQNLCFYGMVCHILEIMVQDVSEVVLFVILGGSVDSNAYLDCPSSSFACLLNQKHGPHVYVLEYIK